MKKHRKSGMAAATRVLIAFVLGQGVQLVCHAVAMNLWEYRQIPFCAAAGFLVLAAVFAGMRINGSDVDRTGTHEIRYEDLQ